MVHVDFRGLCGNSHVPRPLESAALAPSPPHSTETLLIEMKGPSHHLSFTWKPVLPKAQGSALPPLRTHACVVGNQQSEHSLWAAGHAGSRAPGSVCGGSLGPRRLSLYVSGVLPESLACRAPLGPFHGKSPEWRAQNSAWLWRELSTHRPLF